MTNENLDYLVESTPAKNKKQNNNNTTDAIAIAEAVGNAIADKLQGIASQPQQVVVGTNQATSAALQINKKVQDKAAKQLAFQKRIVADLQANKNCRLYAIPKIYKEYQPSFTVSINGCTIKVPADGVPRKIHNRYIDIIEQRLRHLDEKIESMQSGQANIQLITR